MQVRLKNTISHAAQSKRPSLSRSEGCTAAPPRILADPPPHRHKQLDGHQERLRGGWLGGVGPNVRHLVQEEGRERVRAREWVTGDMGGVSAHLDRDAADPRLTCRRWGSPRAWIRGVATVALRERPTERVQDRRRGGASVASRGRKATGARTTFSRRPGLPAGRAVRPATSSAPPAPGAGSGREYGGVEAWAFGLAATNKPCRIATQCRPLSSPATRRLRHPALPTAHHHLPSDGPRRRGRTTPCRAGLGTLAQATVAASAMSGSRRRTGGARRLLDGIGRAQATASPGMELSKGLYGCFGPRRPSMPPPAGALNLQIFACLGRQGAGFLGVSMTSSPQDPD